MEQRATKNRGTINQTVNNVIHMSADVSKLGETIANCLVGLPEKQARELEKVKEQVEELSERVTRLREENDVEEQLLVLQEELLAVRASLGDLCIKPGDKRILDAFFTGESTNIKVQWLSEKILSLPPFDDELAIFVRECFVGWFGSCSSRAGGLAHFNFSVQQAQIILRAALFTRDWCFFIGELNPGRQWAKRMSLLDEWMENGERYPLRPLIPQCANLHDMEIGFPDWMCSECEDRLALGNLFGGASVRAYMCAEPSCDEVRCGSCTLQQQRSCAELCLSEEGLQCDSAKVCLWVAAHLVEDLSEYRSFTFFSLSSINWGSNFNWEEFFGALLFGLSTITAVAFFLAAILLSITCFDLAMPQLILSAICLLYPLLCFILFKYLYHVRTHQLCVAVLEILMKKRETHSAKPVAYERALWIGAFLLCLAGLIIGTAVPYYSAVLKPLYGCECAKRACFNKCNLWDCFGNAPFPFSFFLGIALLVVTVLFMSGALVYGCLQVRKFQPLSFQIEDEQVANHTEDSVNEEDIPLL